MKFLKTSRVCLVTRGRYAGKKVRHPQRTSVYFVGKPSIWDESGMGHWANWARGAVLKEVDNAKASQGARVEEIMRRIWKRGTKC